MAQKLNKPTLIRLSNQILKGDRVDAAKVGPFLAHRFPENTPFAKFMLRVAAWISLFFASVLVIFPEVGEWLIAVLPNVFLLPERLAKALDYLWSLVGKPVKKQHLMYHLPNIIIYAFGVAGVRQLLRKINKNNWKDRVEDAQDALRKTIEAGTTPLRYAPGFSLLFVGAGDRIGRSLIVDDPLLGPTLGTGKPRYTDLWGYFQNLDGDDGFDRVMDQYNAAEAGEYVLFPVVDDHLFLPGPTEYDTPPHRVEIAVQRIRAYEADQGWTPKRLFIVGDRAQTSLFVTSSAEGPVTTEDDEISLSSVAAEQPNVHVVDPTDITLRRIMQIAAGRQIYFRASDTGSAKYSQRFYQRLADLDYVVDQPGALTVGYDISDLETEHQVIAQQQSDYLPVILSRDVFDLLQGRHLTEGSYIFVPHLVRDELHRLVTADTDRA